MIGTIRRCAASLLGVFALTACSDSSGTGTGLAHRAASSFWPKNQPTRAACAASKANLSRAFGMAEWELWRCARLCNGA